jgi:hypothetical protein
MTHRTSAEVGAAALKAFRGKPIKSRKDDPDAPYCYHCHKPRRGRAVAVPVAGCAGAHFIVCSMECGQKLLAETVAVAS